MRQQNFHKKPHTNSFLQTFHTATTQTDRRANAEQEALEFIKAGPVEQAVSHVRPTAPYTGAKFAAPVAETAEFVWVSGWKVRTGAGFVTEKQAKWMIDIAQRPSITDAMRASLAERLEQGFARKAGSQFIDRYKDTPVEMVEAVAPGASTEDYLAKNAPAHPWNNPQVDAGRYAVEHEGVMKFYRVTKGKGRWEGRTFVEVQASDETYALRNPKTRNEVLVLIAANPLEAEQRYGQLIGKCSRCGRTLTDETSRAYGIGPDCRNK